MTHLSLPNIPEELLQILQERATKENTTIQEQVLKILKSNLNRAGHFKEELDKFYERYPRKEVSEEEYEDPFANIRSRETGREVKL